MNSANKVKSGSTYQFSRVLKPRISSQLITLTPTSFHSELSHRCVNEHLDLLWGDYCGFSGILMPKNHHLITIDLGENSYFLNGKNVGGPKDDLAATISPVKKSYNLVVNRVQKPLQLIVDPTHFSYLYEKLTHRRVDNLLKNPITRLKSHAHKNKLVNTISLLMDDCSHDDTTDSVSADAIFESFIDGLDAFVLHRSPKYCINIALKAHEVIIATPHKKITLTEICTLLNVASRTLQNGFKELYGMGFIQYHRLYRLHRIRQYIKKNGLSPGDLTDLIGMYGFDHAGRFSLEYKKAFGIKPSKDARHVVTDNPLSKLF